MLNATITSGQPVPVRDPPRAASTTAHLPIELVREHNLTDCTLLSPKRQANNKP